METTTTTNKDNIEDTNNNNNNNNDDNIIEKENYFKRYMESIFKAKKNDRGLVVKIYREIYSMDSIEWLKVNEVSSNCSIITSLPDISEVYGLSVAQYKKWFIDLVKTICNKLSEKNVVIFYQTDVRKRDKKDREVIEEYIDKSYLVNRGAEKSNCKVVWHKMMTSHPLSGDKIILSRNKTSFSHMICIAKEPKLIKHQDITPDIQPRGQMIYTAAMGLSACKTAIDYCIGIGSDTVLDLFCGKGSVVATANLFGINSIGIDISISRARNSFYINLTLDSLKNFNAIIWKDSTHNTKNKENNNDNDKNNNIGTDNTETKE